MRQSLGPAVKKTRALNLQAQSMPILNRGRANRIETEKSLDRLDFEGYGRADSVRADGSKKSQPATVKTGIKSENIGGKTVMAYNGVGFGQVNRTMRRNRILRHPGKKKPLPHHNVTRKRDKSIFRSSPFS